METTTKIQIHAEKNFAKTQLELYVLIQILIVSLHYLKQDSSSGIFHDDLKLHSILSKFSHSGRVLICSLGLETPKILIFVRCRGTDPKGTEESSYSLQRGRIDISTQVCELQLLSVAEYKAYHSAVCLHRTLEPNYRAVWKKFCLSAEPAGGEKKKVVFLHIHRRIKYLGRKSSLLQMDTYRTKLSNFCAALLVTSIARIHLVTDLKSDLEFLSHCQWQNVLHRVVVVEDCRKIQGGEAILKWAVKIPPNLTLLHLLMPAENLSIEAFESFWVKTGHKSLMTITRQNVRIWPYWGNVERDLEEALKRFTNC